MRRNRGRRNATRRGQSLIEFGLAAVVILVFLFGIMDWAWVFFQRQTIVWRTSEAARWAVTHSVDQTAIQNLILCGSTTCSGTYTGFFDSATITATVVAVNDPVPPVAGGTPVIKNHVRVTVSGYMVRQFTPIFGSTYAGKNIVVMQPMECPKSNCADLNNSN